MAEASDETNREVVRIYADAFIEQKDYASSARKLEEHLSSDPEAHGLAALSFSVDPNPHIYPLPKNMSFVLTLIQTNPNPDGQWEIPFTTGSAEAQTVTVPGSLVTGFCP